MDTPTPPRWAIDLADEFLLTDPAAQPQEASVPHDPETLEHPLARFLERVAVAAYLVGVEDERSGAAQRARAEAAASRLAAGRVRELFGLAG